MGQNEASVPLATLLSDRVLDGVLGFLLVRAALPGGNISVENLARWDLKAALVECLGREGIGGDVPNEDVDEAYERGYKDGCRDAATGRANINGSPMRSSGGYDG